MLLFSMYKRANKYMFVDVWFQTQLKVMMGNSRHTTRFDVYSLLISLFVTLYLHKFDKKDDSSFSFSIGGCSATEFC